MGLDVRRGSGKSLLPLVPRRALRRLWSSNTADNTSAYPRRYIYRASRGIPHANGPGDDRGAEENPNSSAAPNPARPPRSFRPQVIAPALHHFLDHFLEVTLPARAPDPECFWAAASGALASTALVAVASPFLGLGLVMRLVATTVLGSSFALVLHAHFTEVPRLVARVDPERAATRCSHFLPLTPVPNTPPFQVHYTKAIPCGSSSAPLAPLSSRFASAPRVHLWHWFGANLSSWLRVQQILADRLGALVSAHDTPGLGLTERSPSLAVYSSEVDAAVGLLVSDHSLSLHCDDTEMEDDGNREREMWGERMVTEISAEEEEEEEDARGSVSPRRRARSGGRVCPSDDSMVLIGHSLGGLAAARAAVAAPERVRMLILVAPSILAGVPRLPGATKKPRQRSIISTTSTSTSRSHARLWQAGAALSAAARWVVGHVALLVVGPVFLPLIWGLTRKPDFWRAAIIDQAWASPREGGTGGEDQADGPRTAETYQRPNESTGPSTSGSASNSPASPSPSSSPPCAMTMRALLAGYQRPQVIRGWDVGLLKLVRARLLGGGFTEAVRSAWDDYARAPLLDRLGDLMTEKGVKVLILHGRQDRIVPLRNSKALHEQLPGSTLVVLEACGHCPQEEIPERFLEEVLRFMAEEDEEENRREQ